MLPQFNGRIIREERVTFLTRISIPNKECAASWSLSKANFASLINEMSSWISFRKKVRLC
jgi:hypothetical protein